LLYNGVYMGTIFSDSDIRVHVGDSDTTGYVWSVGKAFAEWLPEDGDVAIVMSQSADKSVASAFVEGLILQGRTVIEGGLGGQQEIYVLLNGHECAGAASLDYIEAQNLAVLSLFDAHGKAISLQTGLREINELANIGNFLPAASKGIVVKNNAPQQSAS